MTNIPPCEKDFEMLFGEWLVANTEWMNRVENQVKSIMAQVETNRIMLRTLVETLERFRPMLERYEQASKAQGFRAQSRALKGKA